tara:strand:- start:13 stop:399 length:387 start_codon:yes stop_codon:yes gene_type:complete
LQNLINMYTYKAKLDRVVDGDTIDAHIDLGFDITIHKRIRLAGIDTPESRTRDLEEKKRGLAAKDRLIELLGKGSLVVESREVGKYGRVLGVLVVYPKNLDLPININDTLVKEGYAVEYWGGKKKRKK